MLSQTARRRFGKRERHVGENTTDTRRNRSNARIRKLDPLWEAYHPDVPSTLAKMRRCRASHLKTDWRSRGWRSGLPRHTGPAQTIPPRLAHLKFPGGPRRVAFVPAQ